MAWWKHFLIHDGDLVRTQTWIYPSKMQCLFCHTPPGGFALGFNTAQLNRSVSAQDSRNQIEVMAADGYFASPPQRAGDRLPSLASGTDRSYPLGCRVRSYLVFNCSQCYQPGAPVGRSWDARISTPLAKIVNSPAAYSVDGPINPSNRVIVPHSPDSVLYAGLVVHPDERAAFTTAAFTNVALFTLAINQPLRQQSFVTPGNLPITVEAQAVNSPLPSIELLAGDQLLDASLQSPFSFIWRDPGAGAYSLRARLAPIAGLPILSDPVEVKVVLAPAIAQARPSDSATLGN